MAPVLLSTTRRGWAVISAIAVLLAGAALLEGAAGGPGTRLSIWVLVGRRGDVGQVRVAYPLPLLGLLGCLAQNLVFVIVPGMPRGGGSQLIALMFLVGYLAFRLPGRWSIGAAVVAVLDAGDLAGVHRPRRALGVCVLPADPGHGLGGRLPAGPRTATFGRAEPAGRRAGRRARAPGPGGGAGRADPDRPRTARRRRPQRECDDAPDRGGPSSARPVAHRAGHPAPGRGAGPALGRRAAPDRRTVRPGTSGMGDLGPLPSLAGLDD